ncbi:MAG TPA: cobalt ECF transporter T component CbiQ [Chondromyces sp.]|nr:cobalt ECF transporter T component CbiQ [Chondromyces sp.]
MFAIDQLSYNSKLKKVHPAEKAIFASLFLTFSLVTKDPIISVITVVVMFASSVFGAGVSIRRYICLLMMPGFFLLSGVLPVLFSYSGDEAVPKDVLWSIEWTGGWLYISTAAGAKALELAATSFAGVSCLYFFILTTPLPDILWLMQKIKVPALFIDLFQLTYRFIFILFTHTKETYISQSSRLGYSHYKKSMSSLGSLCSHVFLQTVHTAREVQHAMDSRGGGDTLYQQRRNNPLNYKNWSVIMASLMFLVVLSRLA